MIEISQNISLIIIVKNVCSGKQILNLQLQIVTFTRST